MSLDKAVSHGKEKRKSYRGAKSIDSSCRNHGRCPYCEHSRTHNRTKQERVAIEKESER